MRIVDGRVRARRGLMGGCVLLVAELTEPLLLVAENPPAGWARSTARATPNSNGTSRSGSSPRSSRAIPDALARFGREALSVARLSHPNILAIHEFGRAQDMTFVDRRQYARMAVHGRAGGRHLHHVRRDLQDPGEAARDRAWMSE